MNPLVHKPRVALVSGIIGTLLATTVMADPGQNDNAVCGLKSGNSLIKFDDSIAKYSMVPNQSPSIGNGLDLLPSLPDFLNLIAQVNPDHLCVTAIAIGKDAYQYDRLFVTMIMYKGSQTWVTPMIFQAASAQAYNGPVPKPWVGLKRSDFADRMKSLLASGNLNFSEDAGLASDLRPLSPINYAAQLFPINPERPVIAGTQSYVLTPDVDPYWTTYLVSQLHLPSPGASGDSSAADLAVVQINEKDHRVRMANVPAFVPFGFFNDLESLQSAAKPVTAPILSTDDDTTVAIKRDAEAAARLKAIMQLSQPISK